MKKDEELAALLGMAATLGGDPHVPYGTRKASNPKPKPKRSRQKKAREKMKSKSRRINRRK